MNMVLVVVYDLVAKSFLAPMFFPNERDAKYALREICSDKSTKFNCHPTDYRFSLTGEIDLATAKFTSYPELLTLGFASDFIKKE